MNEDFLRIMRRYSELKELMQALENETNVSRRDSILTEILDKYDDIIFFENLENQMKDKEDDL